VKLATSGHQKSIVSERNEPAEAETIRNLARFVRDVELKNGVSVTMRAIRTSDAPLLARFHEKLSERSVHLRYFSSISLSSRIAPDQLARTCRISDRDFALVAVVKREGTGEQAIIALGQMARHNGPHEVELGLIVTDDFQNQALGTRMCECLLEISRAAGDHHMTSLISWENHAMRHIARQFGCDLKFVLGENAACATLAF